MYQVRRTEIEQFMRKYGPGNCWTGTVGHACALILELLQEIEVVDDVRQFDSGAVRSKDADGTRYDLISPVALDAIAATCAKGAGKYGDYNWEKGMPVNDLLNHALRHIYKFLSGDRSEPHLPHAAWGLMAAIHSHELWPELNTQLRSQGCKPPPQ